MLWVPSASVMAAVLPRVYPQMLEEVHSHQDAGRATFIVSAAGNGVVESLAQVLRMEGGIVQQDANIAAASQLYLLGGAVAGKASVGPGGLLFMAGGTPAGNADLGSGARGSFFGGTVAVHVHAPGRARRVLSPATGKFPRTPV